MVIHCNFNALKFCSFLLIILFWALFGCTADLKEIKASEEFKTNSFSAPIPFATPEVIALCEANLSKEYTIGPGDVVNIDVWNYPKLSGEHLVGPYGSITLPLMGQFKIADLNLTEAARAISALFTKYYEDPLVTVKILKYMNNKVYVLGRVSNPGVIHFSGVGTMLEALAMAGGLPASDKSIFLSKCYVIRGKNQIIWIDLMQLLQKANTKLNIQLANNDIIYIPASMDEAVFVMGEVKNPGLYYIQTPDFSLLDSINLAGGPTEDADIEKIHFVRDMKEQEGIKLLNLKKMLEQGSFPENYSLKDNDIIYIPKRGVARINYYIRQLDPFLRTFISGAIVQDTIKN